MAREPFNPRRNERGQSQSSQPWNQSDEGCGGGSMITGLVSLAGGIGVGAALMYLLDPEAGRERRQHAAELAKDAMERGGVALGTALHSGKETLSSAWQSASESAQSASDTIRESLPSWRKQKSALGRAGDSVKSTAGEWLDSARTYVPSFGESGISKTTAGVSALGALALGLGAMWLFDPSRGRGRRAWISQKATRLLNETGDFFNRTGRHLRNKAKGYYYETSGAIRHAGDYVSDSAIAERVRSALGRLGLKSSSIGVRSVEGRVVLTGRCIADDLNRILDTARGVYGVCGVDNNMEVGDMFGASTTPNTSNLSA
jgi:hypothetical protein